MCGYSPILGYFFGISVFSEPSIVYSKSRITWYQFLIADIFRYERFFGNPVVVMRIIELLWWSVVLWSSDPFILSYPAPMSSNVQAPELLWPTYIMMPWLPFSCWLLQYYLRNLDTADGRMAHSLLARESYKVFKLDHASKSSSKIRPVWVIQVECCFRT